MKSFDPNILNESNKKLLLQVEEFYDVSFQVWRKNYCEVYSEGTKATICLSRQKRADNASIAHELLHLWLKGFDTLSSNHIFLLSQNDPILSKIFDKQLCDHIGNCMEHVKMFPVFLELGYDKFEFLKDSNKEKSSKLFLKSLRLKSKNQLNTNAINAYIGNLIAILADPIERDYSKHHDILRELDVVLYSSVLNFWLSWLAIDLSNFDPIMGEDQEMYDELIESVREWVELN